MEFYWKQKRKVYSKLEFFKQDGLELSRFYSKYYRENTVTSIPTNTAHFFIEYDIFLEYASKDKNKDISTFTHVLPYQLTSMFPLHTIAACYLT